MNTPVDSAFINVDLELRSSVELTPLRNCFRPAVHELHYGEFEGEFLLVVELVVEAHLGTSALRCTDGLLALVESMPPALRSLWDRCDSRRFDYGFEGGFEGRACAIVIDVVRLRRMAALGIELAMTSYPFRASPSGSFA